MIIFLCPNATHCDKRKRFLNPGSTRITHRASTSSGVKVQCRVPMVFCLRRFLEQPCFETISKIAGNEIGFNRIGSFIFLERVFVWATYLKTTILISHNRNHGVKG